MIDRRRFLKAGTAGAAGVMGMAQASSGGEAGETAKPSARTGLSGVGGYGYRLPEFRKGSRLLFLGDSITDMQWGRNESDRNHYLGHSYVYLIAARLGVDLPEAGLEFFNRGISGNKIGDLRNRWRKDAIDMKPDVLSILVGVNDVSQSGGKPVPLERWEADYRSMLDDSRQANAGLRLVLLDPFVLASGRLSDAPAYAFWRGEVDRLRAVVAGLARDYGAVHVKTQDVFDAAATAAGPAQWIWDGVHPLPQGHELIARHWLHEVSAAGG